MKRPWTVLIVACLLSSCRNSQPATNPFLRTTVPPPATTPGVVVTPGQPYAAGIAPPVVTTPVPATTLAPVTTQPVPVTPAPAPVVAPPSVAPQGDQFNPPGGSYLYHQSSNQPQPTTGRPTGTTLAATAAPGGVSTVAFTQPTTAAPPTAVQGAAYIQNPYVQPTTTKMQAPQAAAATNRGDPPESATRVTVGGSQQQNGIRIVSPPVMTMAPTSATAGVTTSTSQAAARRVMRVTAGSPQPTLKTTFGTPTQGTNLSITSNGAGQTTANFASPSATRPGVVQAAFQPASGGATADYAHAADYGTLRGRLEYSQTSRQWKLRYIPIDGQTDDFGGSVVLNDSPALASFQNGDLVAVQGLLSGTGSTAGFSPRYTLTAIQRMNR